MYFQNINTLQEAKNLFRDLCKKLHPDTSGYNSEKEFILMFEEFKKFNPNNNNSESDNFNATKFYDLLKRFDVLKGIQIHFVGSFIWLEDITPNATYLQREVLKSIFLEGYNNIRFATKKKMWYFSPINYIQKNSSNKEFEDIKLKYGYESFISKEIKKKRKKGKWK